jgi:hypothetical protein
MSFCLSFPPFPRLGRRCGASCGTVVPRSAASSARIPANQKMSTRFPVLRLATLNHSIIKK